MDEKKRESFLEQLDAWHQEDEFQKIIDAVEALPQEDLDYELIGLLARAYENKAEYGEKEPLEHALRLLGSVASQGKEDPNWHFRVGYALYYLDREAQAIPHLQRVMDLIPDDPIAREFWSDAQELLDSAVKEAQAKVHPESYTKEQLEAVESHIAKYFGRCENVFHELYSPDIHVDICVIPPSPRRKYYTLITLGMGAHRMKVPPEQKDNHLDRAELLICLPADWKITEKEETWYWPLRWLKILARLPGKQNSWLGWGHSVANPGERPFADNTKLCGMMLSAPGDFPKDAARCALPDGETVRFYQLIPLYQEELDYKLHNSADALLRRFQEQSKSVKLTPVQIDRLNVCIKDAKKFRLKQEDIRPLLVNWQGLDGCIATDRIVVDGCKVGYCYRMPPHPRDRTWDSGWRFLAGDEDKEYMKNPSHSGIYHLNTICNYDPDLLPILQAPFGSAFRRDKNGKLLPVLLRDQKKDSDSSEK